MKNPIYALLQALPTNGWTTVIPSIGAILFGLGGIIIGELSLETGVAFITGGLAGLGIGNKIEKLREESKQ